MNGRYIGKAWEERFLPRLTKLEIERIPKEQALVVLPVGAVEQHGPRKYGNELDAIIPGEAGYVASEQIRDIAHTVFHEKNSPSIQHLIYQIGLRILSRFPQLSEIASNQQPYVGKVHRRNSRLGRTGLYGAEAALRVPGLHHDTS